MFVEFDVTIATILWQAVLKNFNFLAVGFTRLDHFSVSFSGFGYRVSFGNSKMADSSQLAAVLKS